MKSSFFTGNRRSLSAALNDGIIVLTAHGEMQQRADMAYPFSQESNFWYLTGIDFPDWQLVIDVIRGDEWLIAPEIDEVKRLFDGGASYDAVVKTSGIKTIVSRKEGDERLRKHANNDAVAYTLLNDTYAQSGMQQNDSIKILQEKLTALFDTVNDCRVELSKQRAIKQPEEIAATKQAVALTTEAFALVRRQLPSLSYEYEVEAVFTYEFRSNNSYHAYTPIVAGAGNACTLHYTANGDRLQTGTGLLIDIGAAVDGYAADITRTFSVQEPSERFLAVHAAVEQAHHDIIDLLKPELSVREYHKHVDTIMKQQLINLGLLEAFDDDETYRRYFPHAISHGLGIDVHDSLGRPEIFQPDMILTVEPGIYIPEEGIGVRIEDDILITSEGHNNLSAALSTAMV